MPSPLISSGSVFRLRIDRGQSTTMLLDKGPQARLAVTRRHAHKVCVAREPEITHGRSVSNRTVRHPTDAAAMRAEWAKVSIQLNEACVGCGTSMPDPTCRNGHRRAKSGG